MGKNYFLPIGKWLSFILLIYLTPTSGNCQTAFCNDNFQPAFDECESITCTVCDLNGYTGSTAGYGGDPDGDLHFFFCSSVESVQYIQFYAAVPAMTITVTVSNCTVVSGIDLGVMPGCDTGIPDCQPGNGTNSTTLSVTPAGGIGSINTLIIDVDAIGDCNYVVSVNPPNGTIPANATIPNDLMISGNFNVCPNATEIYQVTPISGYVADYIWTGPAGTTVNGFPVPTETSEPTVTITWGNTGGVLCVKPYNGCHEGNQVCHNVTVTPIPPTIFPPATVCGENSSYILPWGPEVFNSGTYSTTLTTDVGCDSTLTQAVSFLTPIFKNLPPVALCEDDCITVCGQEYCGFGNYSATCQAYNGCDSTVNFSITPPNLVADILGGGTITCAHPSITLSSAPSSGIKIWHDSSGSQIGVGGILTVTHPGTYFLSVDLPLGSTTCTAIDSIVIPLNTLAPPLSTTGAELGCDTLPVYIHAGTTANPALYTWSGPNGFTSNLPNPIVPDTGTYFITVVDLTNGCSSSDTVRVTRCCHIFAGTLDSTLIAVCGPQNLLANFHQDQNLAVGDTLVFILYTNPADPLGSILMYGGSPLFPFAGGLQQFDSTYYVAALAGPLLPNHTLNLNDPCHAHSHGQPVMWMSKPTIVVTAPPAAICKGDCLTVTFDLTGRPPFQFHYEIWQTGVLLLSKDETADALQKTITVCPADFLQPPGTDSLDFKVNFLQDVRCGCGD